MQEVHRDDPEERKTRMNVPASWAVLDSGPTTSLSGAEPAILSAQGCEKKGRGAGDDRKAEAVEGKYQIRGIGEQVDHINHKTAIAWSIGRRRRTLRTEHQ